MIEEDSSCSTDLFTDLILADDPLIQGDGRQFVTFRKIVLRDAEWEVIGSGGQSDSDQS